MFAPSVMLVFVGLVVVLFSSPADASASNLCDTDCSGHGECSAHQTCKCQPSWAGRDCSFFLDLPIDDDEVAAVDIVGSTCHGGCSEQGRCEAGVCVCQEGYFGPSCADTRCANDCVGHGSCNAGRCQCESGWLGQHCEMQAPAAAFMNSATVDIPAEGVVENDGIEESLISDVELQSNGLHGEASRNGLKHGRVAAWAKAASDIADGLQAMAHKRAAADAKFRLKRAVRIARQNANDLPGHEFAGGLAFTQRTDAAAAASTAMAMAEESHACSLGCSGHGKCDLVVGGCSCDRSWSGTLCDTPRCPNDCTGNGMCVMGKCVCGPQFFGTSCDQQRCPQDCSGHGYCFEGKCQCAGGFGGSTCLVQSSAPKVTRVKLGSARSKSQDSSPMRASSHISSSGSQLQLTTPLQKEQNSLSGSCPKSCNEQGLCIEGTCLCNDGYQGIDCSILTVCNGNGRLQESLMETGESIQSCLCNEGFAGRDCERQLICADASCSGHGICLHGKCTCNFGYSGHSCHISMKESAPSANSTKAGLIGLQTAIDPMTASWMRTAKKAKWISSVSARPQAVELQVDVDSTAEVKDAVETQPSVWHPAIVPEAVPATPAEKPDKGPLLAFLSTQVEVGHQPPASPEWMEKTMNQSSGLDGLDSLLADI